MNLLYIQLVSNHNKPVRRVCITTLKCKLNHCRETPVTEVSEDREASRQFLMYPQNQPLCKINFFLLWVILTSG